MNIVADKISCGTLETAQQAVKTGQEKRDWVLCSQTIAAVMSRRMSELSLTQIIKSLGGQAIKQKYDERKD